MVRHRPLRTSPDGRDLRELILTATRSLLDGQRYDEVSVADIVEAAGVSRASFYFYFAGKHDVLAELVRAAVADTRPMATPWLELAPDDDPEPAIRASHQAGAEFWAEQAPLLRAIVETWPSDPRMEALWRELMDAFAERSALEIATNQQRGDTPTHVDPSALAATLTWLGERLYSLAAAGVPPFDDQRTLVDMLTYVWMAALHPGLVADTRDPAPRPARRRR